MIKLIIFDFWNTLCYRQSWPSTSRVMLKRTCSKIPKNKFTKIFENSVQRKKWKTPFAAYTNLCKNMDIKTTKENIDILLDVRKKAESKTKAYAYAIPLLKQLRKKGYKTGLVSNSSIFAVEQIKKRTNLLKYIDYPLFSFDVGVIKPHPKIFKQMLKISKLKPNETVMIGDNKGDDVIPPRKLGMKAIHYQNPAQLKKELKKLKIL